MRAVAGLGLVGLLVLGACSSSDDAGSSAETTDAPELTNQAPEPTEAATPETTIPAPAATTTEPAEEVGGVESVRFPEIAGVATEVLAEQSRRAALDGQDTFYWPDGNIGSLALDDGSIRYFAANSTRIARTIGDPTDPTLRLEVASQGIEGVSDEFAYAAGGPVHLDEASGTLLLWYHAERHLAGDAANFHAAVGLARSDDLGETFVDLGIIIETNAPPDPFSPCCADVGGAPVVLRDGTLHLWFRDRLADEVSSSVQLAMATAPVDEVVAAALEGTTSSWTKYDGGDGEPGLGGRPRSLERGNPKTSWFDVVWHEGMERYLAVIAVHGAPSEPSSLFLTSSPDGVEWSPRQLLTECGCELTYPSFLDATGSERIVSDELTVVYVTSPPTVDFRWQDTSLERMTVRLTGDLVTGPSLWSFDDEREALEWGAGGDAEVGAEPGALVIDAVGPDPYITIGGLGLSADELSVVRITMTTDVAGVGQVFFTTALVGSIDEERSARFDVATGTATYEVLLADVAGWSGLLDSLRIDPIDQPGTVRIDAIELG